MNPKRYRKRPVEIEALQWTGDNAKELQDWTEGAFYPISYENRPANPNANAGLFIAANCMHLHIETGEWVLKDQKGFYPCKPDIFAKTYEDVES